MQHKYLFNIFLNHIYILGHILKSLSTCSKPWFMVAPKYSQIVPMHHTSRQWIQYRSEVWFNDCLPKRGKRELSSLTWSEVCFTDPLPSSAVKGNRASSNYSKNNHPITTDWNSFFFVFVLFVSTTSYFLKILPYNNFCFYNYFPLNVLTSL